MGDLVPGPLPANEPGEAGVSVYALAQPNGRLWQGEILENVIEIRPTVESVRSNREGEIEVFPIAHELAIVVSQDCDLEQDYNRRAGGQAGTLPNTLLCDVYLAEILRAKLQERDQLGRTDWRKRIGQNQNERFHYLQRVRPDQDLQGQGLTAMALDFRLYFTIPTEELYVRLLTGIRRRCRLTQPYVEHLSHRFFKFQSRVALPQDHQIDPIPE